MYVCSICICSSVYPLCLLLSGVSYQSMASFWKQFKFASNVSMVIAFLILLKQPDSTAAQLGLVGNKDESGGRSEKK